MRIEFVYTPSDLKSFIDQELARSPYAKTARRRLALFLFSFVAAFSILAASWEVALGAISVGAIFVYFLCRSKFKQGVSRKWLANQNKGTFGNCAMEIDADGLKAYWPTGSLSHQWSSITKIVTTSAHTFFYTQGFHAVILPSHAVISGNYAEFIEQAKDYLKQANDRIEHGENLA